MEDDPVTNFWSEFLLDDETAEKSISKLLFLFSLLGVVILFLVLCCICLLKTKNKSNGDIKPEYYRTEINNDSEVDPLSAR